VAELPSVGSAPGVGTGGCVLVSAVTSHPRACC
jgi:hypothetical protein